jgi:CRP/FNR family transcriptional regulator, cyclic AMP receptor protein
MSNHPLRPAGPATPSAAPHVKKLLNRIRATASAGGGEVATTSGFFSSMFDEDHGTAVARTPWSERAAAIGATPIDRHEGQRQLEALLAADARAVDLGRAEIELLLETFHFAQVAPGREVITQDERGDYLLIVLDGVLSVDRVQLWGDRVNLGESRRGDVLGEMSLLDAGPRFSSCSTLRESRLAILEAASLDRLVRGQPRVALALVTMLARRLSLRLRHVSTRLTALLVRR